jgi:hypothetical protein
MKPRRFPILFPLVLLLLAEGCNLSATKDVSFLADVLRKEPTVEICENPSSQTRIKNPFSMMSDGQISEFLSGFALDYVTYVPVVELRAEEFTMNYMENHLVVNFKNPNSGKWVQVSRKRADIDNVVFQKIGSALSIIGRSRNHFDHKEINND